jgi:phosphoribosylformylglycinamidine cyclo-ligase
MLDVIVCGRIDQHIVTGLVAGIAAACREQGCELVGGETSEQPKVLEADRYVLAASLVGVVDRAKIIDGSAIRAGDLVLALPSNGPHTNGYSLIHELTERHPNVLQQPVGDESFLDAVLQPHTPYYQQVRAIVENPGLHGLVHITGGGMRENVDRVLPSALSAEIDLAAVRIPEVFAAIKQTGRVSEDDMLRTFNLGVGMIAICARGSCAQIQDAIARTPASSYVIGEIAPGAGGVQTTGALHWPEWRPAAESA